jgi:hypothetical protein
MKGSTSTANYFQNPSKQVLLSLKDDSFMVNFNTMPTDEMKIHFGFDATGYRKTS